MTFTETDIVDFAYYWLCSHHDIVLDLFTSVDNVKTESGATSLHIKQEPFPYPYERTRYVLSRCDAFDVSYLCWLIDKYTLLNRGTLLRFWQNVDVSNGRPSAIELSHISNGALHSLYDVASGLLVSERECVDSDDVACFTHSVETGLRVWCYTHGVELCDYSYEQILRYKYYLEHKDAFISQQREYMDKQRQALAQVAKTAEEEYQRREYEERMRRLEDARLKAKRERERILEAERLATEREARNFKMVKDFLVSTPDLLAYCKMVYRDVDLIGSSNVHVVFRDCLGFYELELTAFETANYVYELFMRGEL